MPCTYYTTEEYLSQSNALNKKLLADLDETTLLLCRVIQNWPAGLSIISGLKEWDKKHQDMDRQRKLAELEKAKKEVTRMEEELGIRK